MDNNGAEVHVVFGAGPLGLAVVRELVSRDRAVRVVNRSGKAAVPQGVEVTRGDATDPASARAACQGAAVVYHCASAPYAEWPARLPPILRGIIEGAAAAGARLVYGDNLYAYGPVAGPLTEDLPYHPVGPNPRTRAQMADELMEAHRQGRVQATIGRASDFYGPYVRQSTLGERVFGAALAGKPAQVLGNPDLPHTVIFIDDFARGLVTLGEHAEAFGEVWHIPSAETLTPRQFVALVFAEAGAPVRLSVVPRLALVGLGLFNPEIRAVREVLYQSEAPWIVDDSKFESRFGRQVTPHQDAIRQTLNWYRGQALR